MIVIPMAGLSRRFVEAGYEQPKYMLPLPGGSVFDHAVGSFKRYFDTERFLIIARAVHDTPAFVAARCAALGIRHIRIAILDWETAGQAETVALGLKEEGAADFAITVFNIDTFRPNFVYPDAAWFAGSDGYLEVFEGEGPNWSYVRPSRDAADAPLVAEIAEKRPISNLCSTGLYHFTRASDMLDALALERARPSATELFLAPLYNHLIARGQRINYYRISRDAVQFCGVPCEYEAFVKPGRILKANEARSR